MALYTLEELHSKTADYISDVVNHGFRIDPDKSVSDDPHTFKATLYNKDIKQSVEICTKEDNDSFTRSFNIYCSLGGGFGQRFNTSYYKVHDNIYADSKEEAIDARNKFYASALGVNNTNNPIQAFADKLGEYITNCFKKETL